MSDDPFDDPTVKLWVEHVKTQLPKLRNSATMISLVPDRDHMDVQFFVQLGAAICWDKPIIAVALTDEQIPPKFAQIADEIVYAPNGVDEETSHDLQEAMARVIDRLGE